MQTPTSRLDANHTLKLLFEYLTKIASLKSFDAIIYELANMGRALASAERCSVWVVSDDKKFLQTKVAHGIDAISIPINSGIVGDAVCRGKNIILDDVYSSEKFNQNIDKEKGYTTKSMMVIPMYDNKSNEIIGAFQVMNSTSTNGIFDTHDLEYLSLASTYAAETIISAKLSSEIENTQKEVVFTMGAIGESRSKETGNHVKRVAEYSKLLALAYGLDEKEAELLKQASPMHDIGKIAIADSILNKPGRFTMQERNIMNRHAQLGYSMLQSSTRPLLRAAAIVAYEHHEKWDGSGYPRGLKEQDIHIYGRITAIADVFDALGSERVYKKAWADEKIFTLFKQERAKHFDPDLIDIFFNNIEKICAIREKFKDSYKEEAQKRETGHKIKILGAYGTKAKGFGTSSFLLSNSTVIDAGNLLDALAEDSLHVENIYLTHSHLDHISDIAYIIDNYFSLRTKTLNIIGLPQTIEAIKKDFLNDVIWPDFSKIRLPDSDDMVIAYQELQLGEEYTLGEKKSLQTIQTDHTVPSCGYIYKVDESAVLITADTYSLENIIQRVNHDKQIKSLVVECSFPSEMQELAKESKHLTAKLLFEDLKKLQREDITLYINHIKPQFLEKIIIEIEEFRGDFKPIILKDGDFVYF